MFLSTLHSSLAVNFSEPKNQWGLIEDLNPCWIPSDVSVLNEEGRKVAKGKRGSDEGPGRAFVFFPNVRNWRGGLSFYSTVFAPLSSGRAGASL